MMRVQFHTEQERDLQAMGIDSVMEAKRMMLQKLRQNLVLHNEPEPIFPQWFFDDFYLEKPKGWSTVNWLREGF